MDERFHILKKLPNYPVELAIVKKHRPGVNLDFHVNIFGLEVSYSLDTALTCDYRVMDKNGETTYFIGNSPIECEMWLSENHPDSEDLQTRS